MGRDGGIFSYPGLLSCMCVTANYLTDAWAPGILVPDCVYVMILL